MQLLRDDSWKRRGFSLLWGSEALSSIATPRDVISIREFFGMKGKWPEDLPASGGNALVVIGFDGCLDTLNYQDAETWICEDFVHYVYSFQEFYEGQAALIFWVPNGNRRIEMLKASENYVWKCVAPDLTQTIPIGRCLWSGAENDAKRIIQSSERNPDPDGSAWIGLYHPRIS